MSILRTTTIAAAILAAVIFTSMPLHAESKPTEDFSILHITDIHVNPHLLRSGQPGPVRGHETIVWLCQENSKPQLLPQDNIKLPIPSLAIATGDLTEYGVIDDTWDVFERAFAGLPCPMYVVPGNHDNTWVAMYHIMRQRHGGANYSFDKHGVHFVCLCSASPQEPVPSLGGGLRVWLAADLAATTPGTPIVISLHHPPYGSEFPGNAEFDPFNDLLLDHNVVLMLYGHGHSVKHLKLQEIDGVMGGSTFGKNAGYGMLSVIDGVLRYAYHYHHDPNAAEGTDPQPVWRTLLEKPLERRPAPRLFDLSWPAEGATITNDHLVVDLAFRNPAHAKSAKITMSIGGKERNAQPTPSDRSDRQDALAFMVAVDDLPRGAHILSVRAVANQDCDLRARLFHIERAPVRTVWSKSFATAFKAGLVLADGRTIVAGDDGVVRDLNRTTGIEEWHFKTGGEILGTPTWSSDSLVLGSGDGKVYALDRNGEPRWKFDAGLPVYGPPLIDGDTAFVGDNGGNMHALDLKTGKPRWKFERADFAIESQPVIYKDMLVFGAWDGFLYALDRATGKLRWKSPGPKSATASAARYYAPADCSPVVVGDTLFVCDRGYQLGTYNSKGELLARIDEDIAAIAPSPDGLSLFARGKDDRVLKLNGAGEKQWETQVPAGRFPVPPTARDGKVYVCSNRGMLSVLDTADGKLLWQYQVTPTTYVMAPVAVGGKGTCYVAGVDGSVTAIR